MRGNKKKNPERSIAITKAQHLKDFTIALSFNTGEKKIVDFLPLFLRYAKGDNMKFFSLEKFKKFIIRNGNISWGPNEDIIFSIDTFYSSEMDKQSEKVLYVI